MANNLEIEAQRQALVTSIRDAAQALRDCANKTDTFANYLQNVFPVPQPYQGVSFQHHLQSAPVLPGVPDGPPVKRRPGRPKKTDHDDDPTAPDDGAVNGDGKKRKRQTKEKKPRDPNAPKRPPSAYLLYQNQVRKEVQAANPNIPYGEILTHISKAWAQLSENDRAPYNEATEIAKAEYEKKKSAYEATLKSTAEAVVSPATAASVPAHQDTSEDEEHPAPAPVTATTAARIKSPLAVRPSHPTRSVQVAQPEEGPSDDEDEDGDDDEAEEEEKELVPPPKKRARKSEHPAPPPPPVVTKVKKERKERKDKKN